jgi:hypothetical protein
MNDTNFKRDPRRPVGREAKSDSPMYGRSLVEVFSAPDYDCRMMGRDQRPEFAVTRVRSEFKAEGKVPEYPPDNAILVCVSLIPARLDQWHAIYNGRRVGVTRAIPLCHNISRSELPYGDVGARAVRLPPLLPLVCSCAQHFFGSESLPSIKSASRGDRKFANTATRLHCVGSEHHSDMVEGEPVEGFAMRDMQENAFPKLKRRRDAWPGWLW